jgi:iron complex transport system ATP-binding protein
MIEANGLSITLGDNSIITDISFRIEPGETVALVGPNGAGKSTLIRAMLGLIRPTSGTVCWRGIEVHKLRGQDRGAAMAWLPQHGVISEAVPVLEFVKAARFRFDEGRASSLAASRAALEAVGAGGLESQSVSTLSGGELQRVMVATLVAQDAALFLLDEPANHLDPAKQTAFYAMLRAQQQSGRGVLCITHDMNLLSHLGPADPAASDATSEDPPVASSVGGDAVLGRGPVRVIGMSDGRIRFACHLHSSELTEHLSSLFGLPLEAVVRGGRRYFLPGSSP